LDLGLVAISRFVGPYDPGPGLSMEVGVTSEAKPCKANAGANRGTLDRNVAEFNF